MGRSVLGLIGTFAAGRLGFAQQQPAPVTAFTDLRRGVGIFTGRGGTIGWLVDPSGSAVVDTQMPGTAEIFLEGFLKRSPGGIDLLINSHHHFDHTGGNPILRPRSTTHLAHARVPELQRAAAGRMKKDPSAEVVADTTYTDSVSRTIGSETITLRYWGPAHTAGDSVIHFEKANIVHTGDLVFNSAPPVIDTAGGSSVANWIVVLEKIASTFDTETLYVFGHGSDERGIQGRKADLLAMRDYLTALLTYVTQGLKAGKTEDALAGIEALPGFEVYATGRSKERFQGGIRQTVAQVAVARESPVVR